MAKVEIYNPKGAGWLGTRCKIDGKELTNMQSVDFHVAVDEIPCFTFHTLGMPQIDMDGALAFRFTPKTVDEAKRVLRAEFKTGAEIRGHMVKGIYDLLQECKDASEFDKANKIVDFIIGNDTI